MFDCNYQCYLSISTNYNFSITISTGISTTLNLPKLIQNRVALALGTQSVHDYINHFSDRLGMLIVRHQNITHTIGKIIGNRAVVGQIVCHQHGYMNGTIIPGPWIRLPLLRKFSTMKVKCKDGDVDLSACSNFEIQKQASMFVARMYVDYISCYDGDEDIKLSLTKNLVDELTDVNGDEGIPLLTLYGITARVVITDVQIDSFCRHLDFEGGENLLNIITYGGFMWNVSINFNCLKRPCFDIKSVQILDRYYDGPYLKCFKRKMRPFKPNVTKLVPEFEDGNALWGKVFVKVEGSEVNFTLGYSEPAVHNRTVGRLLCSHFGYDTGEVLFSPYDVDPERLQAAFEFVCSPNTKHILDCQRRKMTDIPVIPMVLGCMKRKEGEGYQSVSVCGQSTVATRSEEIGFVQADFFTRSKLRIVMSVTTTQYITLYPAIVYKYNYPSFVTGLRMGGDGIHMKPKPSRRLLNGPIPLYSRWNEIRIEYSRGGSRRYLRQFLCIYNTTYIAGNFTYGKPCEPGWVYHDNTCYKTMRKEISTGNDTTTARNITWIGAQKLCEKADAQLAMPDSEKKAMFMVRFLIGTRYAR